MPRVLLRACVAWAVMALTETVHGIAREALLTPRLGGLKARQVGVLTGSILILLIAWLFARWIGATTWAAKLSVGCLWLALMLSFEVGLGRALGASWDRILADYDLARGGLMPIGMLVLLTAPLLVPSPRERKRGAVQ